MKALKEYVNDLLDLSAQLVSDNNNDNYELIHRIAIGDYDESKEQFHKDVEELEFRTVLADRIIKLVGDFTKYYRSKTKEKNSG